jgi:type VI secretion system protein ImpM
MAAGLFGKVPSKRDFIAFRMPRPFQNVWEPWIQESMAASRHRLGAQWLPAFNRAPIWRFWLGADFCGAPVLGAFMSCVDGVGRPFPQTIFTAGATAPLPSPDVDAQEAWCEAAEAILLRALEHDVAFDDLTREVDALAPPRAGAPRPAEDVRDLSEDLMLVTPGDQGITAAFASVGRVRELRWRAATSYWWTIGGEDFPAVGLATPGMPAAERFAEMLTGRFQANAPR